MLRVPLTVDVIAVAAFAFLVVLLYCLPFVVNKDDYNSTEAKNMTRYLSVSRWSRCGAEVMWDCRLRPSTSQIAAF